MREYITLQVPLRVCEKLQSILNSSYRDVFPPMSTYPWLTHQTQYWSQGSGPLDLMSKKVMEFVKPARCADAYWVESQFSSWLPRNVVSSQVARDYIDSLNFFPTAQRTIPTREWKQVLLKLGLGTTHQTQPIHLVQCSNYVASNGVTYDEINDRCFTGPKGPVWFTALSSARDLKEVIEEDERLHWNMTQEDIYDVIRDHYMWNVPFFRNDNPHWRKRRLLWGAGTRDYILQKHLSHGLHADMKMCPTYASKTDKVARYLMRSKYDGDNDHFLNLDYKRYDFHRTADNSWNLRRAVSNLYKHNAKEERIAVYNAISNIYTPLLFSTDIVLNSRNVPADAYATFYKRKGIATSGAGDFPDYNTIYAAGINMKTLTEVDERFKGYDISDLPEDTLPLNSGDNVCVPTNVGAISWARHQAAFGLELKASETLESQTTVPMLRVLHDVEAGGWECVVSSICHKAVTPTNVDLGPHYFTSAKKGWFSRSEIHSQILELKYALGSRTRYAILADAVENAITKQKKKALLNVLRYFKRRLAPSRFYRRDLTDAEIQDKLIALGEAEATLSEFKILKAKYSIEDTLDYT